MKRVAVLAFITLVAFAKFSTPSSHWQPVSADQSGDSGDDGGDDEGDDS